MESHQPQHPLPADSDAVLAAEPDPHFAVSLPGERRVGDHPADQVCQLVVGNVGEGPGRRPKVVTTETTVIHRGPGRSQHLTHPS